METEFAAVSEYLKKIEDEALPSPSRCERCLREAIRMGVVVCGKKKCLLVSCLCVLEVVSHPFFVSLHYAFQTPKVF